LKLYRFITDIVLRDLIHFDFYLSVNLTLKYLISFSWRTKREFSFRIWIL